jgi:hypothetical protein
VPWDGQARAPAPTGTREPAAREPAAHEPATPAAESLRQT